MQNNIMTNLPQGWEFKFLISVVMLLKLSNLSKFQEIAEDFGGIPMLRSSIEELQREIYGV